ncbi:MAG: hypothetical protein AB7I34_07745 [Rhizobiaceae bacterium]
MRYVALLSSVLAFASPALAQAVDQAGAAQLQDSLSRYVGKTAFEKGVLKIAVDGDAYRLAFDFNALLPLLPNPNGETATVGPYSLKLKPRVDGSWDVAGDLFPSFKVESKGAEGPQQVQLAISDGKFQGVFDPNLASFSTAAASYSGLTMVQTDAETRTDVKTGAGTFNMTGAPAAGGGVDITSNQSITDFEETVNFTKPDAQLPFPIIIKSPKMGVDSNGKGIRSRELLDLLAFFVTNAEESSIKAKQAELKSLLLAALPVWDHVDGAYSFVDFTLPSPFGEFSASQLGVVFDSDGIEQDGKLNYGFKLAGLKVPSQAAQFAPTWTVSLLPTDLEINLGGANLNLDGPARKAIEAMDLMKEPPLPDSVSSQIEADFKANLPKFIIGRSFIKNADTEISTSGEVTFPGGNPEKPDVNMTVEATGYDKMVKVIQDASATDPQAQQAFPVLLAVKGFAKTLPEGKLQWVVNVKPDGSVIVNGGMVKGPDAPEPIPQPTDPNAPPGTLTNPNP